MTRLRWELLNALRSMGLPGWVALSLGAACLAAWWGWMLPMNDESGRLGRDNAALERRLAERRAEAPAVLTPQQQLAAFEQRFSGEKSITTALGRLHAVAKRQGVQIDQAEFRLTSEAREPLSRYAIVLPVKADYRALRRFTREAVRELPGLAIEEVNLRRTDAKSAVLEAQLRFVLFVTKAD